MRRENVGVRLPFPEKVSTLDTSDPNALLTTVVRELVRSKNKSSSTQGDLVIETQVKSWSWVDSPDSQRQEHQTRRKVQMNLRFLWHREPPFQTPLNLTPVTLVIRKDLSRSNLRRKYLWTGDSNQTKRKDDIVLSWLKLRSFNDTRERWSQVSRRGEVWWGRSPPLPHHSN